jgi:hypothetical protein
VLDGTSPGPGRVRRTLVRTFAAGPVGYAAALAVSTVLVSRLGWSDADRLVTALCLLVVLWGVAMVWSCTARRPATPLIAMAVLSFFAIGVEALLP